MTNKATTPPLTGAELDEIEAIALAAPQCWYGTYQIADGISDENAVALIEACSPDTVLSLIAQARAQQAGAAPTDLSKRLREAATAEVSYADARLLIGAAEEIERYYGGMMAWKRTAEKKDRDWNAERIGRIDDRCAARAAVSRPPAPVVAADEEISGAEMCDVVHQLREYASNPGYSHNDYADTMRQAANCIESLRARFWNYAVAPSDAKGKADAANMGGLSPVYAWLESAARSGLQEIEYSARTMMDYYQGAEFSATSAADAKDVAQWTKTPPIEQADYWNWDGDPDHAPMIYHVLWSGTAKKCFVSIGQYGITNAIFCDDFGGWWLKIEQPSIPQAQSSAKGGDAVGGQS